MFGVVKWWKRIWCFIVGHNAVVVKTGVIVENLRCCRCSKEWYDAAGYTINLRNNND